MIVGNPLRYKVGPDGEALQVNPSSTISSSTNVTWKSRPCHATDVVNQNIVWSKRNPNSKLTEFSEG